MGWIGGVHAQGVDARVGEDLAAEAGEVAVHAAEELRVRGEQREVPREEGLVDVGELGEFAAAAAGGLGLLLLLLGGELEFFGGGRGKGRPM